MHIVLDSTVYYDSKRAFYMYQCPMYKIPKTKVSADKYSTFLLDSLNIEMHA